MNSEIGKVHSGEAEATALGPAQKRGDDVEAKLATRSGMGICQDSKQRTGGSAEKFGNESIAALLGDAI